MKKNGLVLLTLLLAELAVTGAELPAKPPVLELERGTLMKISPGVPPGAHIQGFCADENFIYVAQMTQLSKYDWQGKLVKKVAAPPHTGDICVHDGKLYAATAYWGPGVKPPPGIRGGIWEFDTELNFLRKSEYSRSFDGITVMNGMLYAGCGPCPMAMHRTNYIMRVSLDTLREIDLNQFDYGYPTCFGTQNICSDGELAYAAFYDPAGHGLVAFDKDFAIKKAHATGGIRSISVGTGLEVVPKAYAGDRKLFMHIRTVNDKVEDCMAGKQIYGRIAFMELKDGKFVDVTDWERIVTPAAYGPGRGFVGPRQSEGMRLWGDTRFRIGMAGFGRTGSKEAHIRELSTLGVDVVNGSADRATLDLLAKYGISIFLSGHLPHWWGGAAETKNGHMAEVLPLSKYDQYVKKFQDHPAISALEIGDEPSALDFPHYGNLMRKICEQYPHQFPYLCIYPMYALPGGDGKTDAAKSQLGVQSYEKYIEDYCRYIPLDYIKTDIYPWGWSVKRSWMIENMRIVADAAQASGRFWGLTMQANQFQETYPSGNTVTGRKMTVNTLRFQALNAMAFGAQHVHWGCWSNGWWTDNLINPDGSINREACDRVRSVNGELHLIADEYDKFLRVSTELVSYKGTSLDDGMIRQVFAEAGSSAVFEDVRTKENSALTVGHFLSRDGSTKYAMLIVASDDPEDAHNREYTLTFKAKGGKVSVTGLKGELTPEKAGESRYELKLRSNEAVFVVWAAADDTDPAVLPPRRKTYGPYVQNTRRDVAHFAIGVCGGFGKKECSTIEHMRKIKEVGCDYVEGYHTSRSMLDNLLMSGVGIVLGGEGSLPDWWGGSAACPAGKMAELRPRSRYEAACKKFLDHPAIWALEHGDEPNALDFEHYGKMAGLVSEKAPANYVFANLFPCYALPARAGDDSAASSQLGVKSYRQYLADYCRYSPLDNIIVDVYPWGWSVKRSQMFENFRLCADAAQGNGREWELTPQANRFNETYGDGKTSIGREMTVNTLRFQAFNAMAFGARSIQWACWANGWWDQNLVNHDGSFNEAACARVQKVNAEIRHLAVEFDRFRRLSTELVAFKGTSLDDGEIGQRSVAAAHSAAFAGVRTEDDSALTVGHFVARDGSGQYAMLIVAADDPEDVANRRHALAFAAPGRKVRAIGSRGTVKIVARGDGTYRLGLRSNEAVFVIAENPQ